MKSSRAWILVILLCVIAIATFFLFTNKGGKESKEQVAQKPVEQLGSVVVVKQDIPARVKITADMIEVQQIPAEYIHPMSLLTVEDAIDLLTLVPINAGEQLLKTKIADPNTNYLSYRLKEGYVSFTVPISELTSAGGMIRVGDKVNVMGNFAKDVAGKDITSFFLYDITVVAIGQDMAINNTAESSESMSTMTLEVLPKDAETLAWAQNHGSISFILKSVNDKETGEKVESVDAKTLFGDTEEYKDLEYLNVLTEVSELRGAEQSLNEIGRGDVQQIREKLDYKKFYYDKLEPSSSKKSSKNTTTVNETEAVDDTTIVNEK